jgi:hypothetical protein
LLCYFEAFEMSWWHSLGLPGTATDRASIKFPFELELVPDLLRACIFVNEISLADERIMCWTFASSGLKNAGQKEIVISVRVMPDQHVSDFPQAPLEFFKAVLQHAVKREFIDVGSITDFGEKGFLARTFRAAAYVRSQPLGEWFGPTDTLALILLTKEELAASEYAGLTRVMAMLGKASRQFPCPAWNDPLRTPVVTAEMLALMSESLIAQIPRLLLRDSGVSSEGRVIDLQLPLSTRRHFKQLEDLDREVPLLLLVDFDERADALLIYQEDKMALPLAISAPGTQGNRVAGSFICFAPAQGKDHGMIIEDGFALSMRQETWQQLRQSLINGSPFYLSREDDGYDFRLSWHQDEALACSPNTIQISGADLEKPDSPSKAGDMSSLSAYATDVILVSPEDQVKSLIDPVQLKRYILHIEDTVRDHFMCMGQTDGFQLLLKCRLLDGNRAEFEARSNPVMDAEDEKDLLDRLSIAYVPSITSGVVEFKMNFAVWGGLAEGESQ